MSFVDSTPQLADGPALAARLSQDGYLFFRQLLPHVAVMSVRADVLRVLRHHGWLAPGTRDDDGLPAGTVHREHCDNFWSGYSALQELEPFHQLAHHRALLEVVRSVLGDEGAFAHPRKIARVSYPAHPEHTTSAHQDFPYVQGAADTLTGWIPLGDCSPDLGGLRILRGSHRCGLLPVVPAAGGDGGLAVEVDGRDPAWVSTDYAAGDVLFFLSLTVHGGIPNKTERLRLSVDYRYQARGDPVTLESLLPHFFPRVPGWEVLTGSWRSTDSVRELVGAPATAKIASFLPPDRAPEPPPSRFAATPV